MITKICTKCNKEYPATLEYFKPGIHYISNLTTQCRECFSEYQKEYQKEYCECHPEYQKEYYSTLEGYLRHIYSQMKQRCTNSKTHNYNRYGGRGIKCLFESFKDFKNHVVNILKIDPRGLQIDRIDNDGHYEPGNIRFVTCKENNNNRG